MGDCNWHTLQGIKASAKKKKKKVVVQAGRWGMGGVEVYVVREGEEPSQENWVAWLMEVSNGCVC